MWMSSVCPLPALGGAGASVEGVIEWRKVRKRYNLGRMRAILYSGHQFFGSLN
jgi:hypothetical protein